MPVDAGCIRAGQFQEWQEQLTQQRLQVQLAQQTEEAEM